MHRIGVIGLGQIATSRHVPVIQSLPNLVLAGVCDMFADLSGYDVPTFRSHEAMLAELGDLDAVAICTPPAPRRQIALDAIEAGIGILLEKPPCLTVADVAGLETAAKQKGVVLFTAWHSQHNPAVTAARALLADQVVVDFKLIWTEDHTRYHLNQDWIWRAGGFGVFDPGVNAFSILTQILPQPALVKKAELLIPKTAEMPIAAKIEFGISGSDTARGSAQLDWRAEAGETREIVLTTMSGMTIRIDGSGRRLSVNGKTLIDGERVEYPILYRHFGVLLDERRSDCDAAPLALAHDALQLGTRIPVAGLSA